MHIVFPRAAINPDATLTPRSQPQSSRQPILLRGSLRAAAKRVDVPIVAQGGVIEVGAPTGKWQLIVVYRGKHCPVSRNYLASLQQIIYELDDLGVEVLALTADGREKAEAFVSPVACTCLHCPNTILTVHFDSQYSSRHDHQLCASCQPSACLVRCCHHLQLSALES